MNIHDWTSQVLINVWTWQNLLFLPSAVAKVTLGEVVDNDVDVSVSVLVTTKYGFV